MELKPGYQQTNVGVLPKDWTCTPITVVAKLESGHTPSRRQPLYWGGDVQWVSLHDTDSLDASSIARTKRTITREGLNNSSARLLPAGTVVFSRTATVGKCTVLATEMATSQDFACYVCGPRLHNQYLMYLFRGMGRVWRSLMAGSIHNTIYMPVFRVLAIPLPPPAEQRAIATALSDIDGLIVGLEQLIAKKRNIRQGARHQFLTGQIRLPGFNDDWKIFHLERHMTVLNNGVNSRAELQEEGTVRYLHYGDIHSTQCLLLNPDGINMPYLPVEKAVGLDRLKRGDLVFADASEDLVGVGKAVEIRSEEEVELVSGLHTIAVRFDKSVLADGFKAYLQLMPSFRTHLRRLAAGTKVYATNRTHIASAELMLPGVDEQMAIAEVLSDMDAELTALESRLSKTRALKQGMMQELLTGRTRLV